MSGYKVYERVPVDFTERITKIENLFDKLLELSKKMESKLVKQFKPIIALSLKWKFDYLSKTLESPFELENDLNYWIRLLEVFQILGEKNWFKLNEKNIKPLDPWDRTSHVFDFGWTETTKNEDFEISKQIANDRLEQILEMLGGKEFIKNKTILDSGCGPGRYISFLKDLEPKKIIGIEPGEYLLEALTERFKDEINVEIIKGTCEKLSFEDEQFDIVLSNGVLHHTSSDLETMIKDHARVLKKGGVMFIMLIGQCGLESKIWEFLRNFLYDIPINEMINVFNDSISRLRMQGIVDNMYAEYQQPSTESFEQWCSTIFEKIERIEGIDGLDVTSEIYKNDPYYTARFGTGQIRYLCYK